MLTWQLKTLFDSFESKQFKKNIDDIEHLSQTYSQWINDLIQSSKDDVEKLESYLDKQKEIKLLFAPVTSFSSLSFATDTSNATALENIQKLQGLQALLVKGNVRFEKWMSSLTSLDEKIKSSDLLKEHVFYINEIVKASQHALDEDTEAIIAQMRNTGSRAWEILQKKVSSACSETLEINGEKKNLPLQAIRNLAMEKDPDLRKLGYETEMALYEKNQALSAAALNGIKGEAIYISKIRGFDSPLDHTLDQSKMDQNTLQAMLEAIEETLPKFREYYLRKAEILGHKKGLPFYDVLAPLGDSDISMPFEEGKQFVLEKFATYSNELYQMAKRAFDDRWIDVEPRTGKRGGAFCSSVLSLKESRVLLNYTGKFNNVITMAHELGHAFHNMNLFKGSVLNQGSPMPLAETASIFTETIVKEAAIGEASDAEKMSILEVSIQGYAQKIVDIYSRFIFETSVFEARKKGDLSPDQLKKLMKEAQLKTYGEGLDPDILHPYMWMNKPHYYMPDRDFYNFPYAFGLLFAKGLYGKYQSMGDDFIPLMNNLLSSTKKMPIVEVAKQMDIDLTNKAFWQSSLKQITSEIDCFLELSKQEL